MLFILPQNNFHFLQHIVHVYRTCIYSYMLRMVLRFGKILSTVPTEVLLQWTDIVAWRQMPTFWGIAANLQETLVGLWVYLFFFFSLLNQQGWKEGRKVGYELLLLPVVALKCHIQYPFVSFFF